MASPFRRSRSYSVLVGIAYGLAIGYACWVAAETPDPVLLFFLGVPLVGLAFGERALTLWGEEFRWEHLGVLATYVLLVIALLTSNAPAKLRFLASRSELEEAAEAAPFRLPRKVGHFVVHRAEIRDGYVILKTANMDGNYVALVRRTPGRELFVGNVWHTFALDSEWQFFMED